MTLCLSLHSEFWNDLNCMCSFFFNYIFWLPFSYLISFQLNPLQKGWYWRFWQYRMDERTEHASYTKNDNYSKYDYCVDYTLIDVRDNINEIILIAFVDDYRHSFVLMWPSTFDHNNQRFNVLVKHSFRRIGRNIFELLTYIFVFNSIFVKNTQLFSKSKDSICVAKIMVLKKSWMPMWFWDFWF